ncbi:MAG TPA: sigma-70 family RNA polymerase sigma factor [Verrucomicrobiae bacterium]
MNDDAELLNAFIREDSETAFRELVSRHIDLVYSAALRVVGSDTHLAKDVVQLVFIDLARKANSLPAKVLLPGWLYRHTCFTASKAVRTERRRLQRETIATHMNAPENANEPPWEMIVPHLDAELNRLNRADRDALVLRFFKQQSFQAVGVGLGVSQDAAQMRVSRAVEKLRNALKKRGLLLTTGALAAGLSAEAAVVAPASWAVGMSALSLAAASAAGAKFGFLSFMSAMKMKGTLAAVGAALLGVATVVIQHRHVVELREENRALRVQGEALKSLQEENTRLLNERIDPDELARLRKEQRELIRLRGETAGLRRDLAEARVQKTTPPPPDLTKTDDSYWVRNFSQEVNANIPAGHTLLLGGWETKPGSRTFVLTTPSRIDPAGNKTSDPNANQVLMEAYIIELTEAAADELGLSKFAPPNSDQDGAHQLFRNDETQDLLKQLKETEGADILSAPRILTLSGQQGVVSITQPFHAPNGHELQTGPVISILPNIDPKTDAIDLAVKAEMNLRTDNEAPKL